ncbi:MAG: hypothetical protein E6G69_18455 [Alphaproteobacteria bacterium]|nr:MAG: hypothetical protein E6G69_18455 [Alphaproteobacteria bacterium]
MAASASVDPFCPRLASCSTALFDSPRLNRLADPLLRVIDAFGLDRCMWGTDWTRTIGMLTYEQGVAPFRDTKRLSDNDKAALMGGTLQNVYKW